jgi:hypothetical protein
MTALFRICCFISCFACFQSLAQELKTKNIVIITLDGYRWKELFRGADPAILKNRKFVRDTSILRIADPSPAVSREKLMPFFWNTIGRHGQLYGNRQFKNRVNCTNIHFLSYPGYSELLVGFPDPSVSSNDKRENPNATVLEFIHKHHAFKNRVAAFSTWDVFPYILREDKTGFLVNSGNDIATGRISAVEKALNDNYDMKHPGVIRDDSVTFRYAMEFLKREHPRVLFLGFDETDRYAHSGRYDEYLKSAHQTDQMIEELWLWLQSQPDYKDQTTLFITTDHGRGNGKRNWRNHKLIAPGSGQTWFAVIGPDTPAFGEMKFKSRYMQKQVAKTIAAFLGLQYQNREQVGEVVQTMIAVPASETEKSSPEATARFNEK